MLLLKFKPQVLAESQHPLTVGDYISSVSSRDALRWPRAYISTAKFSLKAIALSEKVREYLPILSILRVEVVQ